MHQFREEEDQERDSHPKKHKKKESSHQEGVLDGRDSSEEDERLHWKEKEK